MTSFWVIVGLIIATISVSILGATFSVVGLGALFSGAVLAVGTMAAALEFAKFVLAAYLHQRWAHLHLIFKTYLVFSVVVLSGITSMGIFGFLSDAYQSASAVLEGENIKLEALKTQQKHNMAEIARLNKAIDEIPDSRVTKKIKTRAEAEPTIAALSKQSEQIDAKMTESNLRILEVKQRVGPLIYIARAFQMDIDVVVKYLILVIVSVFDPLAICLVIATSEALGSRKKKALQANVTAETSATPPPEVRTGADEVIQMKFADNKTEDKTLEKNDRNAV